MRQTKVPRILSNFKLTPISVSKKEWEQILKNSKMEFSLQEEMCKLLGIPDKQESDDQGDDYKCPNCQKEFKYPSHLKRHIKSCKFRCKLCPKKYSHKSHVDRHMKTVHERERFQCDVCPKEYVDKRSLEHHMKVVHEKIPPIFECSLCVKNFSLKDTLSKHMKKNHSME